jgi:HK97 family phage major capsid protein
MSALLLEGMADLKKQIEMIGNTVKGGIDHFNLNHDNNALSYFETDSEDVPVEYARARPLVRKGKRFRKPKGYGSQFKSFTDFLRTGMTNPTEFGVRHGKAIELLKAANAINTLDSESAGSLVLPEYSPEIASILYENDILGRTNQFTVGGNRMEFPKLQEASRADGQRTGGILGYWIEEGDLAQTSRPAVQGTELKLKKLCVVVYLTQELIDDNGYALEQWVRQAVQREIQFMVGDAIFNGTGGGRPLGILNSPVTVSVAAEGGQSAGTIVSQNILKMYSRRRTGQPVGSYAWFINQDIEPQLFSMTIGSAGSNQVVYLPPGGLSGSPYASLMGLPVIPTEFNQALGTSGDICLANLGNYLTISKNGVQELASQHVEFLREQVAIKFTFRIDGRPLYDTATTPKYSTNTQSDFIVLAAR